LNLSHIKQSRIPGHIDMKVGNSHIKVMPVSWHF